MKVTLVTVKKFGVIVEMGYGEMIMCESGECEINWFHTDCLRITTTPNDK